MFISWANLSPESSCSKWRDHKFTALSFALMFRISIVVLLRLAALAFLLMLSPLPARAQQTPGISDDTTVPVPGAGHDYIGALSETVNPSNGSVSFRLN